MIKKKVLASRNISKHERCYVGYKSSARRRNFIGSFYTSGHCFVIVRLVYPGISISRHKAGGLNLVRKKVLGQRYFYKILEVDFALKLK